MYCLVPEKPLRFVYRTFYLAIGLTFYESINFDGFVKSPFCSLRQPLRCVLQWDSLSGQVIYIKLWLNLVDSFSKQQKRGKEYIKVITE